MIPDFTTMTAMDLSGRASWYTDAVVHLRRWGSDDCYPLDAQLAKIMLGASEDCHIQLADGSGRMSREHAALVPFHGQWQIVNLSKNGTKIDGVPIDEYVLQPGDTIKLGRLMLVAESPRLIALRALVRRFVGWQSERFAEVDEALQCLRDFATRNVSLVVLGQDDTMSVAVRLHREIMGPDIPLVICKRDEVIDPTALPTDATLCVPSNARLAMRAVDDITEDTGINKLRIILCKRTDTANAYVNARPGPLSVVFIAPLSEREADLPGIIQETIDDILQQYGLESVELTDHDREQLADMSFSGYGDLDDTLTRLVLIRGLRMGIAAKLLGLGPSTLSGWHAEWTRRRATKLRSK